MFRISGKRKREKNSEKTISVKNSALPTWLTDRWSFATLFHDVGSVGHFGNLRWLFSIPTASCDDRTQPCSKPSSNSPFPASPRMSCLTHFLLRRRHVKKKLPFSSTDGTLNFGADALIDISEVHCSDTVRSALVFARPLELVERRRPPTSLHRSVRVILSC